MSGSSSRATVTAPSSAHLYDRKKKTLTQLYVTRPELEGAPLQPMHALEIPARYVSGYLMMDDRIEQEAAAARAAAGRPRLRRDLPLDAQGGWRGPVWRAPAAPAGGSPVNVQCK